VETPMEIKKHLAEVVHGVRKYKRVQTDLTSFTGLYGISILETGKST